MLIQHFADTVIQSVPRSVNLRRPRMARQGNVLQADDIQHIVSLLTSTGMTIREISQRTGCSRSTIVSINRKFQIRKYAGQRSSWNLSTEYASKTDLRSTE